MQFTDVTERAGIRFIHNNGAFGERLMPETVGSGAAFFDYDGDGLPDLFLVNGREWSDAEIDAYKRGSGARRVSFIPDRRPHRPDTGRLYHNEGNGVFREVTHESGLDVSMYGMGAAAADYDNDGRTDLFVTALDRCYLFHNEGGGRFRETAAAAGLQGSAWSTSAAWVDYDRDGRLDLFVCRYIRWSPGTDVYASADGKRKSYVGPLSYAGQPSVLYHNLGNGRFEDVSARAGIRSQRGKPLNGKALGVAVWDFDRDGWPDLAVANDQEPNYLFRNNRDGTFSEVAAERGLAYAEDGSARAGMGIDTADTDHSGRSSVVVGNFSDEMLGLYQDRNGVFVDVAPFSEVGRASRRFLTFGCLFVDYDNDSWPDLLTANGHVDDDIAETRHDLAYRERPLVFHNRGQGRFEEVGMRSGAALGQPIVGRGLAAADIDLDGDSDLLFTTNGDRPLLLRNDGGSRNHSVRVILRGTRSNRSGIGAELVAHAGPLVVRATVRSGSSYLSQSELPATLGLGTQPAIDRLEIRWPSGGNQRIKGIAAGQIVEVDETRGIIRKQAFSAGH